MGRQDPHASLRDSAFELKQYLLRHKNLVTKMYGVVTFVVVLLAISYAQAMMLGGFYDVEVNDANVTEVATWAVGEMGNNLELLEILNAQKQVNFNSSFRCMLLLTDALGNYE